MWGGSCFGQGIPCDAKGLPTKYLGVGPPAARGPGALRRGTAAKARRGVAGRVDDAHLELRWAR